MTAFDPVSALIGGGLIGLAALLLMLLNGRIAGVSGRVAGRLWHPARRRLHVGPRRVRRGAALATLHRRHAGVHGKRDARRCDHAPWAGSITMLALLAALSCGLLFGAGLVISGMTQPQKVLGFLDVLGIASHTWDPTLAFVMAGALAVAAPGFALVRRRRKPICLTTWLAFSRP